MIRPFTCLVFLLACGSGLYLYQSKHRVKMLDDQIAQIARSTDALRAQTRMLSAEWTLLNDPERLRQLASQFLTLQTVSPNQFTSLADLDSRLPPPPPPAPPADSGAPVDDGGAPSAQAPVPMASNDSGRAGADEGKPAAAKVAEAPPPVAPKAASSAPRIAMTMPPEQLHPAERKPASPRIAPVAAEPHVVASQARLPEPRGPDQRPDQRMFQPRFAEARSMAPISRAPMPSTGGSLLGMAHGMGSPPAPIPLPRPMPVGAPSFSYSNGG
jgi:hypothetical protein